MLYINSRKRNTVEKINYTIEYDQVIVPIAELKYHKYTRITDEDSTLNLEIYHVSRHGICNGFTLYPNNSKIQVVQFKYRNKLQTDVSIPPKTTDYEMEEIYIPKIISLIKYYKELESLEQL